MDTVRVTDYTNYAPPKLIGWKNSKFNNDNIRKKCETCTK